MSKATYYARELAMVDTAGKYKPNLCIRSMNGQPAHEQMKHLTLTRECAQALADWLHERYRVAWCPSGATETIRTASALLREYGANGIAPNVKRAALEGLADLALQLNRVPQ